MRITSSSISSSDTARPAGGSASGAAPADPWRRAVLTFAVVAAGLFLALWAAIVVLDPYDTGRFALLRVKGVPFQTPRTANASRARDPAFDSAVIGNSRVQLLSPAGLSAATGLSVVSLAVPATGPRESFTLLDYFLRQRRRQLPARAIVIGIDSYWCRPEPEMPIWMPFPFWLYDPNPLVYLGGLVRDHAIGDAFKRVGLALKLKSRPRAEPDGYWDYDTRREWRREVQLPLLETSDPTTFVNDTGRFPALDALAAWLDRRPDGLVVVLIEPPIYARALPRPGTEVWRTEEACRAALARLASARPGVAHVDWRTDRAETRVPENFMDPVHYRTGLARLIDADIAAAILRLRGAAGAAVEPPR